MKKFLIQAKENIPLHDFGFTLIESIKYNNWYYDEQKYNYYLSDNIEECDFTELTPIGSAKFVQEYLEFCYGIKNIKPINIPIELNNLKYTKRHIYYFTGKNISFLNGVFVKSNDKIKGFNSNVNSLKDLNPDEQYLVSSLIAIESEWRHLYLIKN